jgi:hypothetical protein
MVNVMLEILHTGHAQHRAEQLGRPDVHHGIDMIEDRGAEVEAVGCF